MASDIFNMLVRIIDHKVKKDAKRNVWYEKGLFNQIKRLSSDTIGDLGEKFIEDVLSEIGYEPIRNAETDRTQKHWDIKVGNIKIEVKTATVGKTGNSFQHEAIEKDRDFNILVCLDIAPSAIYLTVAPKKTLPFKKPNDNWTVNPKQMHHRQTGIHFKWDLSLKDVSDREVLTISDIEEMFDNAFKYVRNNN